QRGDLDRRQRRELRLHLGRTAEGALEAHVRREDLGVVRGHGDGNGEAPELLHHAVVDGANVGRSQLRGDGGDPAHGRLLSVLSSTTRPPRSNLNVTSAATPAVATAVVIGRSVPSSVWLTAMA